jgi:ABC-type uncharacterized transport system permease subunit
VEMILIIGAAIYALAACGYLYTLWQSEPEEAPKARLLLWGATIYWVPAFLVGAVNYQLCVGTRPWLIMSAWFLGVLYIALDRRFGLSALGSFVTALSTLLCTFAFLVSPTSEPVLSGPIADWVLWIHIALAFLGVIAFGFGAAFSVLHLIGARLLKSKKQGVLSQKLPPLETLDRFALRSVTIGFPFYTVALFLGSIQAVRHGTGEIKLTYIFAAVSWVIYAIVLQARVTAGWRGKRAAQLTVAGLLTALIVVGLYSTGAG